MSMDNNKVEKMTEQEFVDTLDYFAGKNTYYLQDDDTFDYRQANNRDLNKMYTEIVTNAKRDLSVEDFDKFVADSKEVLSSDKYADTNVGTRDFMDKVNSIDPDYQSRFEATQAGVLTPASASKSEADLSDSSLAAELESNDDLGFGFDESGNPVEIAVVEPGVVVQPMFDNSKEENVIDVEASDVKPESNTVDYEGPLGKFTYDKTQFTIDTKEIEACDDIYYGTHYDSLSIPRLHYIGSETDGNKIKIPEGVKSGDFMFDGSNITSTPRLPESLENTNSMFKDCKHLRNAFSAIPKNVGSTSYMYDGCSNLKNGPKMIPANVKDISGMFADCSNMITVPYICDGVEHAYDTFCNCTSMPHMPRLPYSVTNAFGYASGTRYESSDHCYANGDASSEAFAEYQSYINFDESKKTAENNRGTLYQQSSNKSSKDMIAEMFRIRFLQMQQKCAECLSRGVTYGKELAIKAKNKTVELAKAGVGKVKTAYDEKVQPKMSQMTSNAGATVQNAATGFTGKVKTGTHSFVQSRYDKFMEKNVGAASSSRAAQAESKFGGISPDSPNTSTEFGK